MLADKLKNSSNYNIYLLTNC